jgi:alkylhydroperoxidase family enzyme
VRLERAAAEEGAVVTSRNGVDAFADLAGFRASHEIGCVFCRIGMRHTRHHGRDIRIVGEMGKCVDVFFVGCAENQALRQ